MSTGCPIWQLTRLFRPRDRVGDAVYGQATGCLGMAIVADARTLWHQPPAMATAEAAAMPTVFLTAATCLLQSTPMRHGLTVLVHAATGA
jgi:NADPH:quinone reductase-like Zn-dependent oxidoreductase